MNSKSTKFYKNQKILKIQEILKKIKNTNQISYQNPQNSKKKFEFDIKIQKILEKIQKTPKIQKTQKF